MGTTLGAPQQVFAKQGGGKGDWTQQMGYGSQTYKGGKGKAKGDYQRPETDNTVSGILSTHSKILARITQDRREEARRIQWIVELDSQSRVAQVLDEVEKDWNQQRKGKGKGERMDKEKHEALFEMLVKYIHEKTAAANANTNSEKERKTIKYIQRWIEFAYSEEAEGESKCAAQIFRRIGRAGRTREEGAPTLYVLRFRNDTQRCREAYEETIRMREDINKICNIHIRRDNGPKDINERALDDHLSYLLQRREG